MEFNQKSTSTWYDKYRQSTKQLTNYNYDSQFII